jgi:hypothetical protein
MVDVGDKHTYLEQWNGCLIFRGLDYLLPVVMFRFVRTCILSIIIMMTGSINIYPLYCKWLLRIIFVPKYQETKHYRVENTLIVREICNTLLGNDRTYWMRYGIFREHVSSFEVIFQLLTILWWDYNDWWIYALWYSMYKHVDMIFDLSISTFTFNLYWHQPCLSIWCSPVEMEIGIYLQTVGVSDSRGRLGFTGLKFCH